MKSLRHLFALVILAAVAAGLTVNPVAEAKPPARIVTGVFAVTYDAQVTYDNHLALPEYRETQNVTYKLHGRLPDVTFTDGRLEVDQSAMVDTRVKGKATIEASQDDGEWLSCAGTEINVRGLFGIGRAARGIWFLPAHSAGPEGTCISSEGARPPFDLTVPWAGAGNGTSGEKAAGAYVFPVTAASIDVPKWSKPFRIVFADEKCPNYEPESTIACTFVIKGKLTLTRVDREERVNGEVLLPALDPPKLNPQKHRVTARIECRRSCDVEALIGVFGGTRKHPKVSPLHKKSLHLEGGRPTTISMPVSAADLAASKSGLLVMTLRARGGKAQIYPLALGGSSAEIPTMAGAAASSGPGVGQKLILAQSARLRAGAVTVLVSNPNGFRAKGALELRLGKRTLGRAGLAVAAHGERSVAVKLDRSARSALAQQKAPRVSAVASFRDPGGKLRRTTSTLTVTRGEATPPGTPKAPPAPPAEPDLGPDGTYHGSDGLTVLVSGGKVTAFNGQITTYCATSERQKLISFGMFGDDPAPQVGPDGSFAYEATTNYGFVKLKYEGRVSGDTATGNLVVEDRSPLSTSDGRLEFDYCFAGADWTATR